MQLARHVRTVLFACTLFLFLISISQASPIRLSDGQVSTTKRDVAGSPASAGDPLLSTPSNGTIADQPSVLSGEGGSANVDTVNLPPLDHTQTILNHATDGSKDQALGMKPPHQSPPEAADGKVVSPKKQPKMNPAIIDSSTPAPPIIKPSLPSTNATEVQGPDSQKKDEFAIDAITSKPDSIADSPKQPQLSPSDSNPEIGDKEDSNGVSDIALNDLPLPQVNFPEYGEFKGNVSQSTYHPFLAEEDTLVSDEPVREYGPAPYETRYRALDDDTNRFDVLKHWGNLAPYYSSPLYPELQKSKPIPSYCKLKQVHMLHR